MTSGYVGPLKEIPREKFNLTSRSYRSPWREALGDSDDLRSSISTQFPQRATLQPANYRCFNRSVSLPHRGSHYSLPTIGASTGEELRTHGTLTHVAKSQT